MNTRCASAISTTHQKDHNPVKTRVKGGFYNSTISSSHAVMFGQPQKSSCPKHRYFRLIVSTTCVDFFVRACLTVVKRPVLALRPIFEVFLAIGYSFHGKLGLKVGGHPPTINFEVKTYSGTRIGHARNPNAFA